MRLEKRNQSSRLALLLAPVGAVLFTLLVSALLVWWAGAGVAQTYGLLLRGGFGSVFALSETFTRAIPLMLTGLAAAVAFRARLFNIGAEGQLYVGALAAVAVGGLHGGTGFDLPSPLLFGLMLLAAALAGALLLLGPALLKARLGVDEVVTTLLLNFIVLLMVSLMLDGPMKDPTAMGWPQSVAPHRSPCSCIASCADPSNPRVPAQVPPGRAAPRWPLRLADEPSSRLARRPLCVPSSC
jgi:simple sugar transport system permease protein